MSRERRPQDWQQDLERAAAAERELAELLAADPRIEELSDHTGDYDRLDFSFSYRRQRVQLDLKEKIRRYSSGITSLWPEVPGEHLFVLDETVFRRIVWHGGGGYLAIHDHPQRRWAIFGPWELTLGPRRRYQRWGRLNQPFLKGKLLLDLRTAAQVGPEFAVDALVGVIERARDGRDALEAVAIAGHPVPEVGERPPDLS